MMGVAALVASTMYAQTPSTQTKNEMQLTFDNGVFLSSPEYVFDAYFSALVMQPTGSNLHYTARANPLPVPSPNWQIYEIDTDYHFGFDVGIEGVFKEANTNVRLTWERFHSSDSDSVQVPSSDMVGPFFEIGPDAAVYKAATGKVTYRFDTVSLLTGIFLSFGKIMESSLLCGVGYAHIKQTLYTTHSSLNGETVRTINVPSSFDGAGPQIGMDASYKIYDGLRLTAGLLGSFFVGPQKNSTTYKATSPALAALEIPPPNYQGTSVQNKTILVPGFDGKLGLAYQNTFKDHYAIKIEAGYRTQVYIDAIQSIDMGSEVTTPPVIVDTVGVYARTFDQTLSNFALAGPYFTLEFGF